ncbi:Platinum sensitivity protein, partial [Coemansia sp. RSA 1200]
MPIDIITDIASEELVIPKPSMDKLTEISRIITEAGQSLLQRDKLVAFIIDNDYIGQLHELHEVCEDLGAIEALHVIYDIVKHIILLNSSSLFEHIIRDDTIVDLAAMLEYDPDHPVEPGTFRELLHNNARYKQIIPIKDPEMKDKIHQTFRLQCLKD